MFGRSVNLSPKTIEGCLMEIEWITELQIECTWEITKWVDKCRCLAAKTQTLTSRMWEIRQSPYRSASAKVEPEKKDPPRLLQTKKVAKNLSSNLSSTFKHDSKSWNSVLWAQTSTGKHFPSIREAKVTEKQCMSFKIDSNFHKQQTSVDEDNNPSTISEALKKLKR
jgi:hypothetical protein